jgi:hypothetical protein
LLMLMFAVESWTVKWGIIDVLLSGPSVNSNMPAAYKVRIAMAIGTTRGHSSCIVTGWVRG